MPDLNPTQQDAIEKIARLLASLYQGDLEIERVWTSAGGNEWDIPRSGTPINTWFQLVKKARDGAIESVEKLLEIAFRDYPGNPEIRSMRSTTTPQKRQRPTHDEMVDVLASLPLTSTWSGRCRLVRSAFGFELGNRTEFDDKWIDLGKIVDGSMTMDGDQAWIRLLSAAHAQRDIPATALGRKIYQMIDALQG